MEVSGLDMHYYAREIAWKKPCPVLPGRFRTALQFFSLEFIEDNIKRVIVVFLRGMSRAYALCVYSPPVFDYAVNNSSLLLP